MGCWRSFHHLCRTSQGVRARSQTPRSIHLNGKCRSDPMRMTRQPTRSDDTVAVYIHVEYGQCVCTVGTKRCVADNREYLESCEMQPRPED